MSKEPNLVLFTCESCREVVQADARTGQHLIPWKRQLRIRPNGTCEACSGNSWTISVIFAESGIDTEPTAIGLGMAAVTGIGFVQSSTSTHQADYPNIPANVVARLNEIPAERMRRVAEFVTAADRENFKARGGLECTVCGALYVRTPGKVWTDMGYCSKACAAERGETALSKRVEQGTPAGPAKTVRVRCPSGHQFDVAISFRGMIRKCPECGSKTSIPEA